MADHTCSREPEIIAAVHERRLDAEPALRSHASGCASCGSLLAVITALVDDQEQLTQEAPVPSSAIVWWRAQMRSRREAAEQAAQPVSVVQWIAVACAAGLLATIAGMFVPTFRSSVAWLVRAAGSWSGVPMAEDALASPVTLVFLATSALVVALAPVVLYFTLRED